MTRFKRYDERRPWRGWYQLRGWQRIRQRRLHAQPLCVRCVAKGELIPATVVNHIKPHRGDRGLFFAYENTESLCKHCHDSAVQSEEIHGFSSEVGLDGWPLDHKHPANRMK